MADKPLLTTTGNELREKILCKMCNKPITKEEFEQDNYDYCMLGTRIMYYYHLKCPFELKSNV